MTMRLDQREDCSLKHSNFVQLKVELHWLYFDEEVDEQRVATDVLDLSVLLDFDDWQMRLLAHATV